MMITLQQFIADATKQTLEAAARKGLPQDHRRAVFTLTLVDDALLFTDRIAVPGSADSIVIGLHKSIDSQANDPDVLYQSPELSAAGAIGYSFDHNGVFLVFDLTKNDFDIYGIGAGMNLAYFPDGPFYELFKRTQASLYPERRVSIDKFLDSALDYLQYRKERSQ